LAFDLFRARGDTPACEDVLHFNNAGSSLPPRCVVEAQTAHLELEARIGGYEASDREQAKWERAYDAVAALIGCDRSEVAVVENATRAWDMAFYAVPLKRGDRVLTARAEYVSNYLAMLQIAGKSGASVEVVPSDADGALDLEALRRMVDDRVKLVCVTHAAGNGGLVNPVEDIGRIVRQQSGALFLVDACQSAGQLPLDVDRIQADMLSATGRKFLRGPRGVGFLYVRRSVLGALEPPFVDLHAAHWTSAQHYEWREDARRFENWETNYASKIGLAVAVDYALEWGMEAISARTLGLAALLRERLAELRGVTVRDIGRVKSGICTFTVEGKDAFAVRDALRARAVNTSVSTIEAARLDFEARGLSQMVRASVHYYNSEDEVDRFCRELERCV